MLADIIVNALRNIGVDTVTNAVLWLLIFCFVWAVAMKRSNHARAFTQYTPTLLTTLGILGTLAGVIVGLLNFDVNQTDDSIGLLLEVLKTAFTTSLAGMFLSITYKLIVSTGWISPRNPEGMEGDEVSVSDLYGVMREQTDAIKSLRVMVDGDSEKSLVNQIKIMRIDLKDRHKDMIRSVEAVTSATKAIEGSMRQQEKMFSDFENQLWKKL